MTPLSADGLAGIWCTLLLPILADESLDFDRLAADLEHLVGVRPDGIYAHGSAGEFQTLTEAEYDQVNALLADRCTAAGLPFQIGASHPSGQICLERIRRARPLAPSAIQVTLPDWLPLSEHETFDAVARLAAAADPVPLVLYNPPHAKTVVPASAYGRLTAAAPGLIGVKVAGGDAAWHRAVHAAAPELAVFVPGHRLGTEFRFGARGSYSNVACLDPAGALRWHRQMLADPAAAALTQERVDRFFADHVAPLTRAGLCGPAIDKLLAAVGGWGHAGLRMRWPHRSATPDLVGALRTHASGLLPADVDNVE